MDYLDIVFFAVVTVVVLARLWAVFGRRHDDEPQRQNPFSASLPSSQDDEVLVLPDKSKTSDTDKLFLKGYAPASLAGQLDQIKTLDPSFDEKQFLAGAKAAFSMIVDGFARADLSQIERWLAPPVFERFRQAIQVRQAAGQTLESHLERIVDADIVSTHLDEAAAYLTVSFLSYQVNVLRDAQGTIVSGKPGEAEEIRDTWVFMRDLKSGNPNWTLVETRS